MNAGTLTVRVVSDTTGLARDVTKGVQGAADSAVASTAGAGKKVGENARKIGNTASLMVTAPLLLVGKAALNAASDVVEATNKSNVVFGQSAKAVNDFAAGAAKSIGVSKREALAAASGFGALFTTMGIGQDKAAGMSTTMVKLGADMASFSNSTPEEALQALKSGLNGESEPLRRFGVFLSDARVQAESVSSGIVKATKNMDKITAAQNNLEAAQVRVTKAIKEHGATSIEARRATDARNRAEAALNNAMKGTVPALTEAQKAQARYQIIMRDTKQSQGDVARSAKTSAAVQASFSKAARDDAMANLGKALIPLSIQASQVITKLANAFSGLSPAAQKGVLILGAVAAAAGPVVRTATAMATASRAVKRALDSERAARAAARAGTIVGTIAGKAYNAMLVVQRGAQVAAAGAARIMGVAMRFALGPIGIAIGVIALLVAGFILLWKHSETFRDIVHAVLGAVSAAFGAFLHAVQAVFGWIGSHWRLLLAIIGGPIGLAVALVTKHFGAIKRVVAAVFGWITDKIGAAGRTIKGIADRIGGAFSTAFGVVRSAVDTTVRVVKGIINTIIRAIKHLRLPAFSVGVGPIKYHFGGLDPFGGIHELAEGGYVRRTPGGILARIGEGRHDEAVVPLDGKHQLGGGTVQIITHVHNPAPEPASESVNKRLRRLAALGIADQAASRVAATAGATA